MKEAKNEVRQDGNPVSEAALVDLESDHGAIALLQQKARSLEAEIAVRKETEKQLRVSEIRYRRLFEAASDGILILDSESGRITDANISVAALLEITREELLGKHIWEIGLFENREAYQEVFSQLRDEQIAYSEDLQLRAQGGQHRDVELISSIYRTDGHRIIQCNVRDITERKRAEEISSHLAAIVESSHDAIISKTLEGVILSWNKGAERIFGYRAEEVIGKPIYILIPPDRRDEEPVILERLRRGERIDHYETVRVTKSGQSVDISLTVSPIIDKRGRIIGASKIARDITQRKRVEAELREQMEIIEAINRTGQMLSANLNLENVVQVVTDAATELTGARFGSFFYNVTDQDGESFMLYSLSGMAREAFAHFPMPRNTDLFGPTFRGERTIRIDDVKKDPRYGKSSPYFGMPPGHLPVTSYLAVPVISRSGEVWGGVFFGHPESGVFTQRHEQIVEGLAAQAAIAMDNARLFEQARREREKAEEANRAKDEFLATVSHELRTPLNAIIGWATMLRRGRADEAMVARAVETIERNAKSQAQLIEDILDVSRVITGKLRLNIGSVDMASIINSAIDSVQPAANSKGIKLGVVLDPLARHISGDPVRLQQVIWNLLSNAIKFTPSGGRVELRLEHTGSHAQIVVSDTGQGIRPDFLPLIFDRFCQADGSITRTQGGLGLGLAIVRHLVELHGGTVSAESAGEGCGATFTVRLPLADAGQQAKDRKSHVERLRLSEDGRSRSEPLPSLKNVRVLLVDDDRDSIEVLSSILIEAGATVETATSAEEAMELLRWYRPSVMVSDLAMPGEDGYSLIGKVRAMESESDRWVPAVALTALVRVEDRARALAAGFDMFVPKPVQPEELIMVISIIAEPGASR